MELNRLKRVKELHLFNARNAIWISLVGGVIFTAIMSLSHLNTGWQLDENFHIVLTFSINVLLLFTILITVFAIIQRDLPQWKKYFYSIVSSLLIIALFNVVSYMLHRWLYEELQMPETININLLKDAAVATVAVALTLFSYHLTVSLQMNVENERLKNENLIMRLDALESQMDPHFLFNSLNTLSGLIEPDNQRAQQYLQQLASTYRYIIRNQHLVSLSDELQFVDSYCQMMQTRYGDNLHIERHIDPNWADYNIIPISLQLLIENALKHNVVSDRYPLTITIETLKSLEGEPVIRVSNIVRPKQEAEQGNGVGLVNLSKRYMLQCDKDITISKIDNIFSVDVPLVDAETPVHQRKRNKPYRHEKDSNS